MSGARWRAVVVTVGAVLALLAGAAPAGAAPGNSPAVADPFAGPVFVTLDRASALEEYRSARDRGVDTARRAAVEARTRIDEVLDRVLAGVRGAEGAGRVRELFRTRNGVAGVALDAGPGALRALAARPDVVSVRRLGIARQADTGGAALELGRAVAAWQATGRLGEGVRIGIVDSGVDYTHAALGGPGTPEAHAAVDPTTVDGDAFPTAKVVGGIDLAGDDYSALAEDPARTVPRPDPNPMDCRGHGTHVAGIAAGLGVTTGGTTFRGDHRTLTPSDVAALRIAPGTAPGAEIYAIRVFGCDDGTALTALGLDHALDPDGDGDFDDRLDVVNLSLGTAYTAVDDPLNDFVDALTEAGSLVVAAAGNSGDVHGAAGAPGNAPAALSVAAVRDAEILLDGAEVVAPAGRAGPVEGRYGVAFEGLDRLDLTAPVVALGADGCAPFPAADAARVRGALVWLDWDDDESSRACPSAPRAENAAAAGAAGVVLPSTLADFGPIPVGGTPDLPLFQLTAAATAAVGPALEAGTLRIRLAGELAGTRPVRVDGIADTIADFSSRGVRAPAVKPDLAAPGDTIVSAASGTGAGGASRSGTSMASPYVAGVAALVREAHPGWTPAQVKAALVTTAGGDVRTPDGTAVFGPQRVGAGRIDAVAALTVPVLAANAEDPGAVGVTLGPVEVPVDGGPLTRTARIRVVGEAGTRLDVAYQAVHALPGVEVGVAPRRLTVPAGGAAEVELTVRVADPAALRRVADPTLAPEQAGAARQFVAEAAGRVLLTPAGGEPLRVPFSVSPRPVSTLAVTGPDAGVLTLRGGALDQGSAAQAYRSRVGVHRLLAESPALPACGRAGLDCVVNRTGSGGDLRAVGVSSTAAAAVAAGRPADALLGFAVATWAELPDVGVLTRPVVEIDVDGDALPDFRTALTRLPDTDVVVARTVDLRAPAEDGDLAEVDLQPVNGFAAGTDTTVLDTDTWVLPVRLAALGLDPAAPALPLAVRVAVLGRYGAPAALEPLVDQIPGVLRFDALDPALGVVPEGTPADPALLLHPADDGTRLAVPDGVPLLVVLGQNGGGERLRVVAPDAAASAGVEALPVPWAEVPLPAPPGGGPDAVPAEDRADGAGAPALAPAAEPGAAEPDPASSGGAPGP